MATVTLSNPAKKNALNLKILNELRAALVRLSRGHALPHPAGEGERGVLRGIRHHPDPRGGSGEAQVLLSSNPFDDMIRAIESFPSPVIAMLNGFAFGGGLEMAVACDIRIASDQAVFGMTPARLGIIYRPAGLMRFVNTIGLPATKSLLHGAKGERLPGAGPETGRPRLPPRNSPRLSSRWPGRSPGTPPLHPRHEADPRPVHAVPRPPPGEASVAEGLIRACMDSRDLLRGKQAFLEKRKPKFQGR